MKRYPETAIEWDDAFKFDFGRSRYPQDYQHGNVATFKEQHKGNPVPGGLVTAAKSHKPSIWIFPYLEQILKNYDVETESQRIEQAKYSCLKGIYSLDLFDLYPHRSRFHKVIDWIFAPDLTFKIDWEECNEDFNHPLIEIWEDLCFHGDQNLYRHSLRVFDKYSLLWMNQLFAVKVAKKLVHLSIHNGDYGQAEGLCTKTIELIESLKTEFPAKSQQLNNLLIDLKRRKLSAQFFTTSSENIPSYFQRVDDLLSEIDIMRPHLLTSDYVNQVKRCCRMYLRNWSYFAIKQIAGKSREDFSFGVEEKIVRFLDAMDIQTTLDPEELGLDNDTIARTISLYSADNWRRSGEFREARGALKTAEDACNSSKSLFANSRHSSIERLMKSKIDPKLKDHLEKVDVERANFDGQYSLWEGVTAAIVERAWARLELSESTTDNSKGLERYKNALAILSDLRTSLNPKKVRHGHSQFIALEYLIQVEYRICQDNHE